MKGGLLINLTKAVKAKKLSLILALVLVMMLSVGLCTASAAENHSSFIVAWHFNPDGTINLETGLDESSLHPASSQTYFITAPVVVETAETAAIRAVQEKLINLGYDTGGIDGIYGPKTAYAVQLFQQRYNYVEDKVGPITRALLGFYE